MLKTVRSGLEMMMEQGMRSEANNSRDLVHEAGHRARLFVEAINDRSQHGGND